MNKTRKQPDLHMQSNNKCSFILRLWRPDKPYAADCRASLEMPETGVRIGFASLEQLFAFLIDFIESNADGQQTSGKGIEESNE